MTESLTWDELKFSAKIECIRSSMYYDVRSELFSFANAFSVMISVKIVVGNVPQPILCRCCVGVSCFPSLFFLLRTQETLEKMDRILSEERFLLFPQRCLLGNTADLLHFYATQSSVPNFCENCVLS